MKMLPLTNWVSHCDVTLYNEDIKEVIKKNPDKKEIVVLGSNERAEEVFSFICWLHESVLENKEYLGEVDHVKVVLKWLDSPDNWSLRDTITNVMDGAIMFGFFSYCIMANFYLTVGSKKDFLNQQKGPWYLL